MPADNSLLTDRSFWADNLSYVGLAITLIGIYKTYREASKSKTAAEAAKAAAQSAASSIRTYDALSDLSNAHTQILLIKEYIISDTWSSIPSLASSIKVSLKKSRSRLDGKITADMVSDINAAVTVISDIEQRSFDILIKAKAISQQNKIDLLKAISERADNIIPIIEQVRRIEAT